MLVIDVGEWFVLYANGEVYHCEVPYGCEQCSILTSTAVKALYRDHPEVFQTNNCKGAK